MRHRRVDGGERNSSSALLFPPAEAPSQRQLEAAAEVSRLLKTKRPAARRGWDPVAEARAQMDEMGRTGDWSAATGAHLVALYEWLHREVYGVETSELAVRKLRGIATQVATAMVKREFGGDYGRAVEFMRWAWKREQGRETWRRENGRPGRTIGWRLQFGGELATEYRIDVARRGGL